MGRLPESFGGRQITYRIPHVITVFAQARFGQQGIVLNLEHNIDKPFEIHRLIPLAFLHGTPTNENASYEITLSLLDVTRDQPLIRGQTPIASLRRGLSIKTWEWGEPLYLERSEAFQATLGSIQDTFNPAGALNDVYLTLEGFLIITSPATDRRG